MKNILTLILFVSSLAFSQTKIKGKISDKTETLAFASVYIIELKKGTESDLNGKYSLENIPNGSYTINYSIVGYKSERKKLQ